MIDLNVTLRFFFTLYWHGHGLERWPHRRPFAKVEVLSLS